MRGKRATYLLETIKTEKVEDLTVPDWACAMPIAVVALQSYLLDGGRLKLEL